MQCEGGSSILSRSIYTAASLGYGVPAQSYLGSAAQIRRCPSFVRHDDFNALAVPVEPPSVQTVNLPDGRPLLFVRGLDDLVYVQKLTAEGFSASGYFLAAPGKVKTFTLGQDGYGNPQLFVLGLNDRVYAQQFTAAGRRRST